jgi:hypothetical protein
MLDDPQRTETAPATTLRSPLLLGCVLVILALVSAVCW